MRASALVVLAGCWMAEDAPSSPARPAARPLEAAQLARMAELAFDGFELGPRRVSDTALAVVYLRPEPPPIVVAVTIGRCSAAPPCPALSARAGQREPRADELLAPELLAAGDTEREFGAVTVRERPVLTIYQLGFAASQRDGGAFSHAVAYYAHDGVDQIRVVARDGGDMPASRDELRARVSRRELEAAAETFFVRFARGWLIPS